MSHVVAIVDQDTCKVYPDAECAPPGSVIFRSAEELESSMPSSSMDVIRGRLLGQSVEHSPTRQDAARKLWHVLSIGAEIFKVDWSSNGYTTRKDNFGNRKIADLSPIELIQLVWIRGADVMADHFYKKLPKQARQMADMLVDDGRGLWTNEQANAVVLARADEIQTKQNVLEIFNYYKSHLFQKKILRKVSYAEYTSRSEFSLMTTQDKEL